MNKKSIVLQTTLELITAQGIGATSLSQIIKESVMNIRTVLSLDGPQVMINKYEKKLQEIIDTITGKILISGAVYGVSALLQYLTFALILFLAAVYINKY